MAITFAYAARKAREEGRRLCRALARAAIRYWGRYAGPVPAILTALALCVGVLAGAFAAYVAGQGAGLSARTQPHMAGHAPESVAAPALRDHAPYAARITAAPGERFAAPPVIPFTRPRPKIAIIFDDMGFDRAVFDRINALPGALTLSFLPYPRHVQPMVDEALIKGRSVMLHLPMQPMDSENPGPMALKVAESRTDIRRRLAWNLESFDGYTAVNNHMGSRFTADRAAMRFVLRELQRRGLPFVDSVTTGDSAAEAAARDVGATVLSRDVFLDDTPGLPEVRRELARAEAIAREKGVAIVIAHPHASTIRALGPWLVTAPERGFDLVTIDQLLAVPKAERLLAEKGGRAFALKR